MTPELSSTAIITITKEQLSQLPAADFEGKICLIEDKEGVEAAISALREAGIIGFDTETRPSFKKGHTNNVALIQLSTRTTCYLFRINVIGLTQSLVSLLEDPEITKVGLSTHDDFHNLAKIAEIEPQGFIELQNFVKQFRIADKSLSRIYAVLFGKRISKGQRLTNWEAEQLTVHQQAYAALDAMACLEIFDYLASGRFDPVTSEYLTEPTPPEETGNDEGSMKCEE